jgi:hypothetical protein
MPAARQHYCTIWHYLGPDWAVGKPSLHGHVVETAQVFKLTTSHPCSHKGHPVLSNQRHPSRPASQPPCRIRRHAAAVTSSLVEVATISGTGICNLPTTTACHKAREAVPFDQRGRCHSLNYQHTLRPKLLPQAGSEVRAEACLTGYASPVENLNPKTLNPKTLKA